LPLVSLCAGVNNRHDLIPITASHKCKLLIALFAGETDPAKLAALAHRRIKAGPDALAEALRGRVTKHHRFLLRLHLEIDVLDQAITEIDKEVEANLDPFRPFIPLLISMPGIGELAARVILAEIGTDMSRFPTAAHLISWVGLCPRNDESAGKRRSTRMRKDAPWLKTLLIQCAWAATRKAGSYLQALFTGPIPPAARQTWREEGNRCRCRIHAHRGLSHAQDRHLLSGPRGRSLPP
jgi:transposase